MSSLLLDHEDEPQTSALSSSSPTSTDQRQLTQDPKPADTVLVDFTGEHTSPLVNPTSPSATAAKRAAEPSSSSLANSQQAVAATSQSPTKQANVPTRAKSSSSHSSTSKKSKRKTIQQKWQELKPALPPGGRLVLRTRRPNTGQCVASFSFVVFTCLLVAVGGGLFALSGSNAAWQTGAIILFVSLFFIYGSFMVWRYVRSYFERKKLLYELHEIEIDPRKLSARFHTHNDLIVVPLGALEFTVATVHEDKGTEKYIEISLNPDADEFTKPLKDALTISFATDGGLMFYLQTIPKEDVLKVEKVKCEYFLRDTKNENSYGGVIEKTTADNAVAYLKAAMTRYHWAWLEENEVEHHMKVPTVDVLTAQLQELDEEYWEAHELVVDNRAGAASPMPKVAVYGRRVPIPLLDERDHPSDTASVPMEPIETPEEDRKSSESSSHSDSSSDESSASGDSGNKLMMKK